MNICGTKKAKRKTTREFRDIKWLVKTVCRPEEENDLALWRVRTYVWVCVGEGAFSVISARKDNKIN